MKKRIYSVLVLASTMLLAGCSLFTTAEDEAKSGYASFSGHAIDSTEGKAIASSASVNCSKASRMTMSAAQSEDNTGLYVGGVESKASQTKIAYSSTVVFYSNYLMSQEMDYRAKTKFYGGTVADTSMKEIENVWVGDPIDPALTGYRSLFSEEIEINQDGETVSDTTRLSSAMYCQNGDLDNAWGLAVAGIAGRVYEYDNNQIFYRIDDSNYASLYCEDVNGSITNPLFPNDDAKKLGTNTHTEETAFFKRAADGTFYLSKSIVVQKEFVLMDLEQKPLSDPLAIDSSSVEYDMVYETRTSGTIPTYVASDPVPSIALCSLTNTGTLVSSQYLQNITMGYRLLNPNFKGYAFQETIFLSSSNYFALSTEEDINAATPNYAKWGYDNIDKTSILYGTVTSSGVSNYFSATAGYYSVLVLLDSSLALSSIQVSYVHN